VSLTDRAFSRRRQPLFAGCSAMPALMANLSANPTIGMMSVFMVQYSGPDQWAARDLVLKITTKVFQKDARCVCPQRGNVLQPMAAATRNTGSGADEM